MVVENKTPRLADAPTTGKIIMWGEGMTVRQKNVTEKKYKNNYCITTPPACYWLDQQVKYGIHCLLKQIGDRILY